MEEIEQAMEEGKGGVQQKEDVPNKSSSANGAAATTSGSSNKMKWLWILVFIAAAIALGVGLGVGIKERNDKNKSEKELESSTDKDGTVKDDNSTTTTNTTGTEAPTTSPPVDIPTNAPTNGTTTGGGTTDDDDDERLPPVSTETVQRSYESCDALSADLTKAYQILTTNTIERNALLRFHNVYYGGWGRGGGGVMIDEETDFAMPAAPGDDGGGATSSAGRIPGIETDEDSFGTNNQVEGVDEADIVKSNGKEVYAAYGQEIVVLDAIDVTVLNRVPLPKLEEDEDENTNCQNSDQSISSMLLIEDRLVVVTSGYCYYNYYFYGGGGGGVAPPVRVVPEPETGGGGDDGTVDEGETMTFVSDPDEAPAGDEERKPEEPTTTSEEPVPPPNATTILPPPIIGGNARTRVLVYNTNDMSLLSNNALKGSYVSARSIERNVHIITTSAIDNYQPVVQYLDPWRQDIYGERMNETEYRAAAQDQADQRRQDFVSRMVTELGDCGSVQQVSLMQNTDEAMIFTNILESVATVYSFDVTDPEDTESHTSMVFPTSNWIVYASQTHLVLATQGWWISPLLEVDGGGDAQQQTYILAYKLDGDEAVPTGLGTVPGYVLNQFSISHIIQDEVDYIRVATSTRERWGLDPTAADGRWTVVNNSTSQVTILQIDPDGDEETMMTVVGQLTGLGHAGERIYAVRFLGTRGFVVTFRETDPLYTLDLSVPNDPKQIGELEIPGFSNYLHPVGDNYILGVGQHADPNTGRTEGLQVSLFDVSNFSYPFRIQNFVEDQEGYSSSEAQYDHRAFRYLEESKLLIIPLTIYGGFRGSGGDGFDGFRVYLIDPDNGIDHYMSIMHGSQNFYDGCWSRYGYLQARSLVIDGDLMTLKSHSVLSHDLTDREQDAIPINLDEMLTDCSQNYFLW